MRPAHALLALTVVAVWGSNFVILKAALAHFPPLWLAALRFALAALPLFFVPWPGAPWRWVALYGVLIGCGQFGLLFIAMDGQISPGLASLVVQSQVFFTLLLGWALRDQALRRLQWLALGLAGLGMAWLGLHLDAKSLTPLGLALTLAAGLSWGSANLVNQRVGRVPMLGFMVWSSAFAAPVLILLAGVFEGWEALWRGAQSADLGAWSAVFWQALGNTLFGYGIWGWLLGRYEAAQVVPMALLVPLIGMGCSAWWLGESLPGWKLQGAALVMGGLLLNLWVQRKAWR